MTNFYKQGIKLALAPLSFLLAMSGPFAGEAHAYPAEPVTIVVPFGPGGGVDSVARTIATEWSQQFGHHVVVENRPGAAGNIASASVARSKPNGYTLLLGSNSNSYNDFLYEKIGYSPATDLTPVVQIGRVPIVLLGSKTVAASNLHEVISLAKSQPNSLNFVSYGVGSSSHLLLEMLKNAADIEIVHVPYNNPQVYPDLISGRTHFIFANLLEATPYIRGGQLQAIGVVGDKRAPEISEVQSFAEQGYPGMMAEVWWGVMVPTGVPESTVTRINEILNKVLASDSVKTRLKTLGAEVVGGSPSDFASFFRSERAKWQKVIEDAGVKVN